MILYKKALKECFFIIYIITLINNPLNESRNDVVDINEFYDSLNTS